MPMTRKSNKTTLMKRKSNEMEQNILTIKLKMI